MKTQPSPTIKVSELVRKKRSQGEYVHNFSAGDPFLKNYFTISESALEGIETGFCPYPPIEGLPELRKLFAKWMNTDYGTRLTEKNIMVTAGGKFALFSILNTFVKPDDEILIIAPYWVSYPDMVEMAGARIKIIETFEENHWKFTPEDIVNNASSKTKFLIFNNGSNPTGIVYREAEIKSILQTCQKLNITVISDEVYSGLVYDEKYISCGIFPEFEKGFIIQSCSKNFAMTGWRIGCLVGHENDIQSVIPLQSQSTTGVALCSQWAAIGALRNSLESNHYVKMEMKKRRDLFVSTYNSLFSVHITPPESAIYAFLPISHYTDEKISSVDFCTRLIKEKNIALVPGIAFGKEGYVRFAYSESEEDIEKGLMALSQAVKHGSLK